MEKTIFKDLDNILAFKVRYCKPGVKEPSFYRFFLHKKYYIKIVNTLDKLAERVFNKSKEIIELSKYDVDVDNTFMYNFLDNLNNSILDFRKYMNINNYEVVGKNKDIIKMTLRDFNRHLNGLINKIDRIESLKINYEYINNYNDLFEELKNIINNSVSYIQKIIDIEFKDDRYQMLDK